MRGARPKALSVNTLQQQFPWCTRRAISRGGARSLSDASATASTDANAWQRKTVTLGPDGGTQTVYANYLGETLLTDVHDPQTGADTVAYNHYDNSGRLLWTAQPSAFQQYRGAWYDDALPDLVGYTAGSTAFRSSSLSKSGSWRCGPKSRRLPHPWR